jgi:hypothetical protein
MEILLCVSTGFIVGVAFEVWRMARRIDSLERTFRRYEDEVIQRLDTILDRASRAETAPPSSGRP